MTTTERLLPDGFLEESLRDDARAGLTATPKTLPPKWFYDAQGSALFDKITELPEYYPTRAERSILRDVAWSVAGLTGARTLVELGGGSSEKTRLLLDALRRWGTLRCGPPATRSRWSTRAWRCTPSSRTSRSASGCPSPQPARGWSPSSARRSAT
jgi:hypothetical protein